MDSVNSLLERRNRYIAEKEKEKANTEVKLEEQAVEESPNVETLFTDISKTNTQDSSESKLIESPVIKESTITQSDELIEVKINSNPASSIFTHKTECNLI